MSMCCSALLRRGERGFEGRWRAAQQLGHATVDAAHLRIAPLPGGSPLAPHLRPCLFASLLMSGMAGVEDWQSCGGAVCGVGVPCDADSVAAAICFLASNDAAAVNGSIHAVDAGRTAG